VEDYFQLIPYNENVDMGTRKCRYMGTKNVHGCKKMHKSTYNKMYMGTKNVHGYKNVHGCKKIQKSTIKCA
jgi:hypothetical protein